jgi:capsular polysaccharide biosynthesis protein
VELRDYVRILIQRGWIVVLTAIVGAVSAFLFSRFLVTPEYRSDVLLSVLSTRTGDYGSNLGAKAVVNNFAETIRQDDELAAVVADRTRLDLPPDALKGRIQVDPDELNVTITIRAIDRDPIIAKQIAQTYAQAFVEARDILNQKMDQRDRVEVRILRNARDGERSKPQTRVNTMAGAVLGGLLGLLLVFALEYAAAGTIRGPQDIERFLGANVLGTVPPVTSTNGRRSPLGRQPAETRATLAR